jgi:hypothetical protein
MKIKIIMNQNSHLYSFLLIILGLMLTLGLQSQGVEVKYPVHFDVSKPLREMKPAKKPFWSRWIREVDREVPNKFKPVPPGFVQDNAVQSVYPTNGPLTTQSVPILNFNGSTNQQNTTEVTPPDSDGDVGPNDYVELVNTMIQIFNKSGVSILGPVNTNTLWSGFNGPWNGHDDGDGVVQFDVNADRWVISQFAIDCGTYPYYTNFEMIAVSTSPDPTGSYYRYAFQFDYMPDYPKIGVWIDGYYLAVNRFNTNASNTPFIGSAGCVLERNKMLVGDPSARMLYFKTETLGGSGLGAGTNCWSMLPGDCDGAYPATGTPDYFTFIDGNGDPDLILWALHADWTTTSNSTFTYVTALPVTAYTELGNVVPQPGSGSLALDGLGDRLMFRNQYRNFGSYETFVTCHSVNAGGGVAGIRWYEYRKTGSAFALYQQSTYAPGDGKSRWLGSIAMNANGDIGLAYSVSSSSVYPSIYYTGRRSSDALNQMTIAEGIIQTGANVMTNYSRWGDYSTMNIDPSDNTTFWTTQEYVGTYGGWCPWATKIASFNFATTPVVVTHAATSITTTSGTLNGTVNPNGVSTTYHFDWGTTLAYGNSTTTQSAGTGSTPVPESVNITALATGTTYHFRIEAINSAGTSYGDDTTFTPGAAIVITAPVTGITTTSATCGGNVAADGGSAVTARGVCWDTSSNPTVAGHHTTDGSGTGTFTSSLTGLLVGTGYYVCAYATNANGTYYGNKVFFNTSCGTITILPFTENFESYETTPYCWSEENSNPSWLYIMGNGTGHPASAHSGVRDACLKNFSTSDNINQLITPVFDFSLYSNVILTFWHTQAVWSGHQDILTIYYRTSSTGSWIQLATYTGSITTWTQETITLPSLGSYYQIAFQGDAKYGYGVCIDDIALKAPGNWVGGTLSNPTDWNTATNWGDGLVPTSSTNVYIPSRTYLPVVNTTNAVCNNLVIDTTANLSVNITDKITVNGTLTLK